MDSPEALLPIIFNEVTKHVALSEQDLTPSRAKEIHELNSLYRDLVALNADVPPPPNQINGRLNDQVRKLKDAGNASYKKSQYSDAVRMYSLAIEMALKRPPWEASGFAREELSVLYSNRAQAHMSTGAWGDAMVDADTAIYLKRNFPKAHYRKGKCLQHMGRLHEAKAAYELGLESGGADGSDAELKSSLAEVNELLYL
ncbi:TPR-like protein [Lipomyces tetrasporus]|uniref:TPR-like protein n=1 Tax=Lipomyces tetrasporus TaxID=54092 RepID=A0AAD7QVK6_9ASCO|nr:TPR-like protein [Lipomyces tetrasporus]KAJ8102135.1 TPR-like protein [Lipomyces tetrasporus]